MANKAFISQEEQETIYNRMGGAFTTSHQVYVSYLTLTHHLQLSSPSLSTNPTPDDGILGSLRRAVSPFRQPDPLETKSSVYRPPSISTPTSLHSRSNSSSSSIPPITPSEATPPPPPPKPYHYNKRAQTYPIVPYTSPQEATNEMSIATTKRQPELIRGTGVGDTKPSRATSHSDPDLSHQRQQKQKHHHQHHRHHQHDDSSLAVGGTDTHAIIRDLGPQLHTQAKPTPVKERTKGEIPLPQRQLDVFLLLLGDYIDRLVLFCSVLYVSGTEISPLPPMIVPSRRKESLPQGFSTSSKDDLNLNTQQSVSKQSDSTFGMSWGRQKDSVKSESRRASSIFQPHLIPNPNFTSHPEGRIIEEEEEQEPPGTPGIRRKDERNGWSGEWNQETIQEVIVKLRALR